MTTAPRPPTETGWPRPEMIHGPFDSVLTIRCMPEQVDAIIARLPWDVVQERLPDGTVRLNSGWLADHVWSPTEFTVIRMLNADGLTLGWQVDWRARQDLGARPVVDYPRRDPMGNLVQTPPGRPTPPTGN